MALGWFDELKVSLRYMVDDQELDESNQKLREQRELLQGVSRAATVVGTASVAALGLVGRANIEFSETMSRVRAILADRTSHDELAELEDRARRMARELPVGPRETAAAMLEMARAGATMNDVFASTEPVVRLAILGGMQASEVAELMVASAAQFGRPLSDAGAMADSFYSAVINTLLKERDIPSLLRHAGPIAGVMGMGLDEALAFLAGLRQGGMTPEMASTSMRNIVSRLINMTPNQIEAFKRMGIDHEWAQRVSSQGQFLEVLNAMIAADATIADFEQVFQQRALVGAAIYEALGQDLYDPLLAKIRSSEGAVGQAIGIQLDSLYGIWIRLKSIFQEVLLVLGNAGINQFLTALFQILRWGLRIFAEAPGFVQTFFSVMILLGTSLLFVGVGLRMVVFLMGFSFFPALLKGAVLLWSFAAAGGGVSLSLSGAFAAGVRFSTWLTATLLPALLRALFGMRSLAGGLLMVTLGTARAFLAMLAFTAGMVAGALPAALAWAAALMGPVVGALTMVIAKTLAWTLALLANPIVLIILAVAALIAGFVYAIIHWGDAILGFFTGIWQGIRDGADALFGWLVDGISWIGDLIGKALGWLFGGGSVQAIVRASEPLARGVTRFGGGGDFGPTAPPIRTETVAQSPRYEFHNYVDRVDIHAPGGDPGEIGRKFNEMLGEQNKTMVAEFDTGVAG